jgi:hypothetical protein
VDYYIQYTITVNQISRHIKSGGDANRREGPHLHHRRGTKSGWLLGLSGNPTQCEPNGEPRLETDVDVPQPATTEVRTIYILYFFLKKSI